MAYEIPGFSFSLIAGEDLTTSQFCAVDIDSSGHAILPTQGLRAVGVIQNKPDNGEVATVVVTGVTKAVVGVTGVVAGNNVTVDDDGTIIQASSGDRCIGIALQTGGVGTLVALLLLNGSAVVAGS